MAICSADCSIDTPDVYSEGCGVVTRPGGIQRLIFVVCDATLPPDLSDQTDWDVLLEATPPLAVATGLLVGQKPKGSTTSKRVASCSPEQVTGGEKSLTFMDYNTDTVTLTPGGTLQYTFWNTIINNPASYLMFYQTCDGYLYGALTDITVEIDEVIEDSNTGNTFIDGVIKWNSFTLEVPTYAPALIF